MSEPLANYFKKQEILLSPLPSEAQDLSFNYFHRSGNEFYLRKSLHNSPANLFWIHTTFSYISCQLSYILLQFQTPE